MLGRPDELTTIADVERWVGQRMAHLQHAVDEYEHLARIASALTDRPVATRTRAPAVPGGAPRVDRRQQVLDMVERSPGRTVAELAAGMGIGPSYVYRLLPDLEANRSIHKRGRRYYIGPPAEPDAEP